MGRLTKRDCALIEWLRHRTIVIQYSERELRELRRGMKDKTFIFILRFPKVMFEREVRDRIYRAFPELYRGAVTLSGPKKHRKGGEK